MVYLSRIYTRTGDEGETSLGDRSRVPKDHARVTAYGTVDELNAALGIFLAAAPPDETTAASPRRGQATAKSGSSHWMPDSVAELYTLEHLYWTSAVSESTRNPCANPTGMNICAPASGESSRPKCLPKVAEPGRISTATSQILPEVQRINLAWPGWDWKCRPRKVFLTEELWLSCTKVSPMPAIAKVFLL